MNKLISYDGGKFGSTYQYRLLTDYLYKMPSYFPATWREIETRYLWFNGVDNLIVKAEYSWDGPSGPAIHTDNFMRGSLVHDALYQLMRQGYLEKNQYREASDCVLYDILGEDGMWWSRRQWVYWAVRIGANRAARRKLQPND